MGTTLKEKMVALPAKRRAKIEARAAEIIAKEMSLRELRKASGKTQEQMASVLKKTQDQISRVENRADVLISTMQEFIAGLGGSLELVAKFPNREPVRLSGFGITQMEATKIKPKSAGRTAHKGMAAARAKPKGSRERRGRA